MYVNVLIKFLEITPLGSNLKVNCFIVYVCHGYVTIYQYTCVWAVSLHVKALSRCHMKQRYHYQYVMCAHACYWKLISHGLVRLLIGHVSGGRQLGTLESGYPGGSHHKAQSVPRGAGSHRIVSYVFVKCEPVEIWPDAMDHLGLWGWVHKLDVAMWTDVMVVVLISC